MVEVPKMVAANSNETFRVCIGKKIKGVLFGCNKRTLIFDDGTGLSINYSGSFYLETAETIKSTIDFMKQTLADAGEL